MYLYPLQPNFSRGEIGPRLHGRADIDHYLAALKTATNFIVLKQGGLRKRSGFRYVATVKDQSKKVRLLPFIFSSTQAYALEVGEGYTRPYINGGRVVDPAKTKSITGVTQANPAVVTYTGSDVFANGQHILISGVVGMTQLNNIEYTIANLNTGAKTFELAGINSVSFDAYVSGGTAGVIYEFATPWQEADLAALDYCSNADVMTIVHKAWQPREIRRYGELDWRVALYDSKDGPFMREPTGDHASLTFAGSGNIVPKMTSNTAPSGTVSISTPGSTKPTGTEGFYAFDRVAGTALELNVNKLTGPSVVYTLPGTSELTCTGYTMKMRDDADKNGLRKWRLEAQRNGSSVWVVLDGRVHTEGWGHREKKYFPLTNDTPYHAFQLVFEGISPDGATATGNPELMELTLTMKDTEQTATACTASSLLGINNNTGFQPHDVGRQIRVRGSDGLWRWFKITARISTTVVEGKFYGAAMADDGETTAVWQMGSFFGGLTDTAITINNWPQHIANFDERRVYGGTDQEPQTVWLTKSGEIADFGRSLPLLPDDGITFTLSAKRMAPITWLEEADDLVIGTTGGVRTLGPAGSNEAFSATSVKQRRNTAFASKAVKPGSVGSVLIFVDFFGTVMREFFYSFEFDAYVSPDLSILSDHLLKAGITEVHYQQSPDSILWMITNDGELITLTYERDQKVAAMTRVIVAPGDTGTKAVVESMCVIPGQTRDEVWIAVRRTIGGETRRHIERLASQFENMALVDANFMDCSLRYDGPPTNTVSGLYLLEGQTVGVFGDGTVYGDRIVEHGKITLPEGAMVSKLTIGLKYTALARTLAIHQGRDGTQLGRRKLTGEVIFDVMDSLGLKVRGVSGKNTYDCIRRDATDPSNGPMNMRTARLRISIDQSWKDDGEFEFLSTTPEPLTIRGIIPAYSSEGT